MTSLHVLGGGTHMEFLVDLKGRSSAVSSSSTRAKGGGSFRMIPDKKLQPTSSRNARSRSDRHYMRASRRSQGKEILLDPNNSCPCYNNNNNNENSFNHHDVIAEESLSKREDCLSSLKQAADWSFCMTNSSISSLGDGSITTYDGSESSCLLKQGTAGHHHHHHHHTNSEKKQHGNYFVAAELNGDLPNAKTTFGSIPNTNTTSVRSRWDIASQDSALESPRRNSFEIVSTMPFPYRPLHDARPTRRASCDTLPVLPLRCIDDPDLLLLVENQEYSN